MDIQIFLTLKVVTEAVGISYWFNIVLVLNKIYHAKKT